MDALQKYKEVISTPIDMGSIITNIIENNYNSNTTSRSGNNNNSNITSIKADANRISSNCAQYWVTDTTGVDSNTYIQVLIQY